MTTGGMTPPASRGLEELAAQAELEKAALKKIPTCRGAARKTRRRSGIVLAVVLVGGRSHRECEQHPGVD